MHRPSGRGTVLVPGPVRAGGGIEVRTALVDHDERVVAEHDHAARTIDRGQRQQPAVTRIEPPPDLGVDNRPVGTFERPAFDQIGAIPPHFSHVDPGEGSGARIPIEFEFVGPTQARRLGDAVSGETHHIGDIGPEAFGQRHPEIAVQLATLHPRDVLVLARRLVIESDRHPRPHRHVLVGNRHQPGTPTKEMSRSWKSAIDCSNSRASGPTENRGERMAACIFSQAPPSSV